MARRLAVMLVHGVEIGDPNFADTATARLKSAFRRHAHADPDLALTIEPAFWAPVMQEQQDKLFAKLYGPSTDGYFQWLKRAATQANAGSAANLVGAALSGLLPWIPGVRNLGYPTLRWLTVQYIGDAIAYQVNPDDRTLYDEVHRALARTLRTLADTAGDDAPLCVLSHSLGSVIASNYLYDLQHRASTPLSATVHDEMEPTPLEQGHTLTRLYTMGSPLALWTLRHREPTTPVRVPAPELAAHHPNLDSEWVNFYDWADPIASPLKPLSTEYDEQVTEDRKVDVGPSWLSWTPLSHPWYWNDRRVIDRIGASLAAAWHAINDSEQPDIPATSAEPTHP